MYTTQITTTPNGITRIAIYLDGFNVKVIRNSNATIANQQADYYINMMRGVNSYTAWLKKG